jgi:hypothetical protein
MTLAAAVCEWRIREALRPVLMMRIVQPARKQPLTAMVRG